MNDDKNEEEIEYKDKPIVKLGYKDENEECNDIDKNLQEKIDNLEISIGKVCANISMVLLTIGVCLFIFAANFRIAVILWGISIVIGIMGYAIDKNASSKLAAVLSVIAFIVGSIFATLFSMTIGVVDGFLSIFGYRP